MSIKGNYEVKQISKKEAKELIVQYHYLGDKGFRSKLNYGLFDKSSGELIGTSVYHNVSAPETIVGAFGLNRKDQEGIYELGRLVLKPDYNGGNFTSFLVANSIKLLRKDTYVRALISYATSDRHVGYIYQATNFKYYGLTTAKKDFWVDGKIQERGSTKDKVGVWVNRPRKHRYALIFDKSLHMNWQENKYPKEHEVSNDCYGCEGKGEVLSRGEIFKCPICNKTNHIPKDIVSLVGYNEAIADIVDYENTKIAIYDVSKIIGILIDQGLTEDEAAEYFDYNIHNAKFGNASPKFINFN